MQKVYVWTIGDDDEGELLGGACSTLLDARARAEDSMGALIRIHDYVCVYEVELDGTEIVLLFTGTIDQHFFTWRDEAQRQ